MGEAPVALLGYLMSRACLLVNYCLFNKYECMNERVHELEPSEPTHLLNLFVLIGETARVPLNNLQLYNFSL